MSSSLDHKVQLQYPSQQRAVRVSLPGRSDDDEVFLHLDADSANGLLKLGSNHEGEASRRNKICLPNTFDSPLSPAAP